jgi:hypothetical protein
MCGLTRRFLLNVCIILLNKIYYILLSLLSHLKTHFNDVFMGKPPYLKIAFLVNLGGVMRIITAHT